GRPVDLRPDHQRPRGLPAPRTPHIQPPPGRPARRRRPRPPPRPMTFKPPPHTGTLMIHTPANTHGRAPIGSEIEQADTSADHADRAAEEPPPTPSISPADQASGRRTISSANRHQPRGPSASQPPVPRTDISPADPASAQRSISSAAPDR